MSVEQKAKFESVEAEMAKSAAESAVETPPDGDGGTPSEAARGDRVVAAPLGAWLLMLAAPLLFLLILLAADQVILAQRLSAVFEAAARGNAVLQKVGGGRLGESRVAAIETTPGLDLFVLESTPSGDKGAPLGDIPFPPHDVNQLALALATTQAAPSLATTALVRFARANLQPSRNGYSLADSLMTVDRAGQPRGWRIAETTSTDRGPAVPLGSALYSGRFAPDAEGLHLLNAVVFADGLGFELPPPDGTSESAGGLSTAQAEATRRPAAEVAATEARLVTGAAVVALLKAEALGVESVAMLQWWTDRPEGFLPLPGALWTRAVRAAVERVRPRLASVRQILLWPAPDPAAEIAAPLDITVGAPDTVPLGSFLFDLAVQAYGSVLPWQNEAEVLPVRFVALSTFAAVGPGGRLSPAALNPSYRTLGRASLVPALALLVGYAVVLAWMLRRRAPVRLPRWLKLLPLLLVPCVLSALALRGQTWLNRDWSMGWSPGQFTAGSLPLQFAVSTALMLGAGLLLGYLTFRLTAMAPEAEPAATTSETDSSRARLRSVLYREVPVEALSQDRLGVGTLVLALARFLDNRNTEPPLVLAINGPWGSGKSSIIKMLAGELLGTQRFKVAWFNAWQYQNQEQILAAFLKSISQQLTADWGPWFALRLAWVRLKHASFGQLVLLTLPFLLILAGTLPAGDKLIGQIAGSGTLGGALGSLLLAGGGVGALNVLRYLLPFQNSLRQLVSTRDVGKRIGYLDEFQSEFTLYREAVGGSKFVIMIDDLDRCHPNAVVEVLKTINLIVTSNAGPGKTFFVLAFDWHYIVKSVEMHFQEFAEFANHGEGFGRRYLKKIVTVPLSVPTPDPQRLATLVQQVSDPRAGRPSDTPKAGGAGGRLRRAVAPLLALLRRPLPLYLLFLLLLAGVYGVRDRLETAQLDAAVSTGAIAGQAGATAGEAGLSDAEAGALRAEAVLVASLPPATAPRDRWEAWLLVPAAALALVGLLVSSGGLLAAAWRNRMAPREPEDPTDFTEAILDLAPYMPENPRDVVRLVNLMRVAYLVQSPQAVGDAGLPDSFGGAPLDASASVTLTLLQQRAAHLLDSGRLQDHLLPALEAGRSLQDLAGEGGSVGDWARQLDAILQGIPGAAALFADSQRVRRFVEIYRHILEAGEEEVAGAQGQPGADDKAGAAETAPPDGGPAEAAAQ